MVNITLEPAQSAYCAILPDRALNRQRQHRTLFDPAEPKPVYSRKAGDRWFCFYLFEVSSCSPTPGHIEK